MGFFLCVSLLLGILDGNQDISVVFDMFCRE